jgi:anti-sigma B factor antagonist
MEWTKKQDGDWTVLNISGVINIDTANDLKTLFDDVLSEGALNVRLNLKNVPNSNSSGIGHIVQLLKSLKEQHGKLEIRGISRNLFQMLKLLKIDKVIPITETD